MTNKSVKNHSNHLFEFRYIAEKKLMIALSITLFFMMIEIIGGIITNSMALLSDAGHMFTHSFAITISFIAIIIAKKPPCHHRTFGLYRSEILAAFINGLFLIIVVIIIIYEAIQRIINPIEILGIEMLFIAFIGLIANILSISILHGSHKKNLNIKGVFYHMIADAVSSIGIVFTAIIIIVTGWNIIDPIVSLGVSVLIIYWAWKIMKDSTRILLEIAPKGLNIEIIRDDLKLNFPEIKELYNIHLWTIIPEMIVFSAHIKLYNDKIKTKQEKIISKLNKYLSEKYNIIDSTIQITSDGDLEICKF